MIKTTIFYLIPFKIFHILFLVQITIYPFHLFAEGLLYWKPKPKLDYVAQESFKFYEVTLYILGYFDEETPKHITNHSRGHKAKTPQTTVFVWNCHQKVDSMYSSFGNLFHRKEQKKLIRDCQDYNRAIRIQLENLQKASNSHKVIKENIQKLFSQLDRFSKNSFNYSQSIVKKKLLIIDLERGLAPLLENVNEKTLEFQELLKRLSDYIDNHSNQDKKLSELIDLFIADLLGDEEYNEKTHGFFIGILSQIKRISDHSDIEGALIKQAQDESQTQAASPVFWLFKWKRTLKDQIQQEIDILKGKEQDTKKEITNINEQIDNLEANLVRVWDKMLNDIQYHYFMNIEKQRFYKQGVSLVTLKDLFINLPPFYFDFNMTYLDLPLGININAKKRMGEFITHMEKWLGITFKKESNNQKQNSNRSIKGGSSGGLVP